MTTQKQFTIQVIDSNSPYFQQVIQLGDKNSSTLGFLPDEAYQKAADNQNILICVNSNQELVGYLLYYISRKKNIVKLTHLCVNQAWRGQGIAQLLLKNLELKTQHLTGILASCRSDYNLDHLWCSLGFTPRNERQGKSKKGSILVDWWRDYGNDNLLSQLTQKNTESKIIAAIDANIFYDLVDQERCDQDSQESQSLMADWLESEIQLCITDEIYPDINRNYDIDQKRKLREIASSSTFVNLSYKVEDFEKIRNNLRKFFPDDSNFTNSDRSDWYHLAKAIASDQDVQFFVTRDTRLLEAIEEDIYQEFNLRIIRPVELILKLDELRRESYYQPIRLAGTSLKTRKIKSQEINLIVEKFLNHAQGEHKADLNRKLRQLISNSELIEGVVILRDEEKIGFIIYDKQYLHELKIPIFRLRLKEKQIKSTLIRHFLLEFISTAANEKRQFTRINDLYLDQEMIEAIQEDCFFNVNNDWLRINLKIAKASQEIASDITDLCNNAQTDYYQFANLATFLNHQDFISHLEEVSQLEKILYPAKIIDADIPTFIIPIQYWYAKDLFDVELAEGSLFGADENLILRRESVYYRSKYASGGLKAPARILWYVSQSKDKGVNDSFALQSIRACSRLDQILIDKPKNLHKRFRRLGVFRFNQVLEIAKNDYNREIMAIKFSDTELFETPVSLEEIKNIITSFKNGILQAPRKISNHDFMIIYNKGRNLM